MIPLDNESLELDAPAYLRSLADEDEHRWHPRKVTPRGNRLRAVADMLEAYHLRDEAALRDAHAREFGGG